MFMDAAATSGVILVGNVGQDPEVRQFVRGEPDGPVKFHYPARSVAEDFGPEASA